MLSYVTTNERRNELDRATGALEILNERGAPNCLAGVRLLFPHLPPDGALAVLSHYSSQLRLVTDTPVSLGDYTLSEAAWLNYDAELRGLDELFNAAASAGAWVTLRGGETLLGTAMQVLTRYQRYLPLRNAASRTASFDRVLALHAALHDVSKPLVRADFDHALDVWQWVLRLDPTASLDVQLAALFHDIERLESEAERRIEHYAHDYQAFKNAHARGGAKRAYEVLCRAGEAPETAERVAQLIELHEVPHGGEREPLLTLLADADALSFFALNSPGFIDYYGSAHTLRKIAYSLGRMSARAQRLLAGVRLRRDVAELLEACVSGANTASMAPARDS